MAHTVEEKKKLLNRVRRIMGQVAAIEKSLEAEQAECSEILPDGRTVTDEQLSAADDLVSALRAYLK